MSDHLRTGVQRKTLIAALLGAAAAGALGVGVINAVADDGGDAGPADRISEVAESSTTTEPETTTTVEVTTTSEEPTTTTVAPAPGTTAKPVPLEQRVENHEERIETLEATTTTVAPAPPTTIGPPTTVCYDDPGTGCHKA